MASTIVYLHGPSSAGKSTLARALVAAVEDPWCLVSMDTFEGMAARRFTLPDAQIFYDECLVPLIHHAAASFADAGLGVVIEAVLGSPQWLDSAAHRLTAHRVFLVAVRCDLEELGRRERERGNRTIGVAERQHAYVHAVVDDRCGYDFEVDTTHASAEECAERIRCHLTAAPEPTALASLRATELAAADRTGAR